MIEKLSLDEFLSYKKQLESIVENHYRLMMEQSTMPQKEFKEKEDFLINKYVKLRDKVFSYDLSEIDSTEWFRFSYNAFEGYPADLSKTHANIDFSEIMYSPNVNYKSCNITNIERVSGYLDEKYFDPEVVQKYPDKFVKSILSDDIKEKIANNKFNFDDYMSLNEEEKKSLEGADENSLFDDVTLDLIKLIGIQKAEEIYNYSKDDFKALIDLARISEFSPVFIVYNEKYRELFLNSLATAPALDIKKIYYDYFTNVLFSRDGEGRVDIAMLPEQYVRENKKLLMIDESIPNDVRDRFYRGRLTLDDITKYAKYIKENKIYNYVTFEAFGPLSQYIDQELIIDMIDAYPELMDYIIKGRIGGSFGKYCKHSDSKFVVNPGEDPKEKLKEFSKGFFADYNRFFNEIQLQKYKPEFFDLDENLKRIIDTLGIDNIRKFDEETGFFSYLAQGELVFFNIVKAYLTPFKIRYLMEKENIDFKHGTLSYEEFRKEFAKLIEAMKDDNKFKLINYDFIEGRFREENPTLFIDQKFPLIIKESFYSNLFSIDYIFRYPEYSDYFKIYDLGKIIQSRATLKISSLRSEGNVNIPKDLKFFEMYTKVYGKEKTLDLIYTYGPLLENISIFLTEEEFKNEAILNKTIRQAVYNMIIDKQVIYDHLVNNEIFAKEHPDLFIDLSNIETIDETNKALIEEKFYKKQLNYGFIREFPELVDVLKNKNLQAAFKYSEKQVENILGLYRFDHKNYSFNDTELIELVGNEFFLKLCSKYGDYLLNVPGALLEKNAQNNLYQMSNEEIDEQIQNLIIEKCKNGTKKYSIDSAPEFLKERAPELFLSEDAPEELCKYFYTDSRDYSIDFEMLQKHKEWVPYLRGKCIKPAFLSGTSHINEMRLFFELFNENEILKLGSTRGVIVDNMIKSHKVEVMRKWYDKTGGKFIPDYVVMQQFDENEIDKFLASAPNWSKLMKIKSFAAQEEFRDAMLKLAYSFGAFDNDQRGFKLTQELLMDVPRTIKEDQSYVLSQLDNSLDYYGRREREFNNENISQDEAFIRCIDSMKYNRFYEHVGYESVIELLEAIKEEMPDFNFKEKVFTQLYKLNENGSYSLNFLSQNHTKTTQALRRILDNYIELDLVSPSKAHQLFGGFDLKYDPEFREFFLKNLKEIVSNSNYSSYLPSIQKQFDDIRRVNSNRALTLDLAIGYVQTNRFTNIETGNEKVAEVSSIAGYTQRDFEILQKIYNYGKQRVYSSIPRVKNTSEKQSGKYTYEMLRLDDPLALAIGTLSDCCQRLNDCAEMCMEHSMVDKNGRVFVIRDEEGKIVAQSWVWRNKDVLCFDNIEIPHRALDRADSMEGTTRYDFAQDVYDIYKEAAKDLIKEDELVYKSLLEEGKITQEQYDGLRLGKVTVGLGFNDIANAIHQNASVDGGILAYPLNFEPVVKLDRSLYTNDSTTQYIIEERENRKPYEGETITPHTDTFIEYDDSNLKEADLLSLEKLEILTKNNPFRLNTDVFSRDDDDKDKNYVSRLAYNYNLNPDTTKVILHPNFAIIYDNDNGKVKIGDLLFNTKMRDINEKEVDFEDKVVMQLKLALNQIGNNREIDTSKLNPIQLDMYNKAMNISEELDIERGVEHAR